MAGDRPQGSFIIRAVSKRLAAGVGFLPDNGDVGGGCHREVKLERKESRIGERKQTRQSF